MKIFCVCWCGIQGKGDWVGMSQLGVNGIQVMAGYNFCSCLEPITAALGRDGEDLQRNEPMSLFLDGMNVSATASLRA